MSPVRFYSIDYFAKPQYLPLKKIVAHYMQSFSKLSSSPTARDIEHVFNALFAHSMNTVLIGGAVEPYYRVPDVADSRYRIYYREDYVSSSLHELAHWLVAGPDRRQIDDWGYWYAPDGRDAEQQAAFEQVEVKPQALEWLLHIACGLRFRVSLDNLSEHAGSGTAFKNRVYEQALANAANGVNDRVRKLYDALSAHFGAPPFSAARFRRADLD
jgi:elongation factor P hydroxylase